MPLPLILGVGAAIAGATGVGAGIHGAVKMKEANDTVKLAKTRHDNNIKKFETEDKETTEVMDKLGKLELEILNSFNDFSDVFEKIKNKPEFGEYSNEGITLPKYDGEKLREVSVSAGVILGGLGGAGLGVAGGYAAAGATTSAVIAWGTASTGTAISTLNGAALAKATMAAIGGGAINAGGGGIALGTTILGATTLGAGLLVGGVIFNFTGGKLSDKADEAWAQMKKAEKQINEICEYLIDLKKTANKYHNSLSRVNRIYKKHLNELKNIVYVQGHDNWNSFTNEEKNITQNTVLLVGLLYDMCKVELVLKSEKEDGMNTINKKDVEIKINNANTIIHDKFN